MHIVRCVHNQILAPRLRHTKRGGVGVSSKWQPHVWLWTDFMKFYLHRTTRSTLQLPDGRHGKAITARLSQCIEVDWSTYLHQVKINAIPRVKYHTPAWMMGPEPTQHRKDRIMNRHRDPDYQRKYRCKTCKGLDCGLSCRTVDNWGIQTKRRWDNSEGRKTNLIVSPNLWTINAAVSSARQE